MQKKVLFIDWHGTLSDSKFWEHLEGSELHTIIEKSLFGNLKGLVFPWMRGEYCTEEIIKEISGDIGIEKERLLNEFIFSCQNMKVEDAVLIKIQEVRSLGVKVYIATDNMDSFMRWTVPTLNLTDKFDGILCSHELKALKGDFEKGESLFFRNFLNSNSLLPSDCVLIDDSVDKNDSIKKYGILYRKIKESKDLLETLHRLHKKKTSTCTANRGSLN